MNRKFASLFIAFLGFLAAGCGRNTITGTLHSVADKAAKNAVALAVIDGDTLTVAMGGQPVKVRIEGIDAPEPGQPFDAAAKAALATRVGDHVPLQVVETGKTPDGLTLARILVGGINVGLEMVNRGWAWHIDSPDQDEALAAAEEEARKNHRGLWADPAPVAPWEWRHGWRPDRHPAGKS